MSPIRVIQALIFVVAVVGSTLTVMASPAAACSCAGPPFEVNEDFGQNGVADYEAVFVGSVTDSSRGGDEIAWTFEIDYLVHGTLATPITIITAADGAACGFENLSVGDERAVGVRLWEGEYQSGLCSIDLPEAVATISFRAEPTIAEITNGSDGLSTDSGLGLGLVATGFAAVVAALAGAVMLSRRSPSD